MYYRFFQNFDKVFGLAQKSTNHTDQKLRKGILLKFLVKILKKCVFEHLFKFSNSRNSKKIFRHVNFKNIKRLKTTKSAQMFQLAKILV
jgi:cAMP phosphodiesterase